MGSLGSKNPPRRLWALPVLGFVLSCTQLPSAAPEATPEESPHTSGPRILAVIAHPDDETTFAGTLYKCATLLEATCDVLVITNGEGGYKYSTLAERIYGLELTNEDIGRAHLPRIRKREMKEACQLLGVNEVRFLRQRDHRYTTDALEVLSAESDVWNKKLIRSTLRELIHEGDYEFVFTLLPTPGTHGHHKAATLLALEIVASLPRAERPIPLGAAVYDHDDPPEAFRGLDGNPLANLDPDDEAFVFDRTQSFGFDNRLDYRIIVNWVIAAHKSQGTMQLAAGRGEEERFFLYALAPTDAPERTRALFERLQAPQFPPASQTEAEPTVIPGSPPTGP